MTLSELVRSRRLVLGLSQREAAERLEISVQYLCDIEHGYRTPDGDDLLGRIADGLKLDRDVVWFAAGRLTPDVRAEALFARYGVEPDAATVCAAFEALRHRLVPTHFWRWLDGPDTGEAGHGAE